jgi:hypothetical protein
MTEISTEDFTRYDPAVDRVLCWEDRRLVLRLGHECNTPLYALSGFATAAALDKPETWKGSGRVSWTFRLVTDVPTDRLVVKPVYEWVKDKDLMPAEGSDAWPGFWWDKAYRVQLICWRPDRHAHVHVSGQIHTWDQRVFLASGRIEADLLAIAEVIETLSANPAAVLARAREHCGFCGKALTDAISQQVGYGPDCAERYGLAHSARAVQEA